jgi:hypothetical protein
MAGTMSLDCHTPFVLWKSDIGKVVSYMNTRCGHEMSNAFRAFRNAFLYITAGRGCQGHLHGVVAATSWPCMLARIRQPQLVPCEHVWAAPAPSKCLRVASCNSRNSGST